LTLAWRGPYKVFGKICDVDYRVEIKCGKVKTYYIFIAMSSILVCISQSVVIQM